MFMLLPFRPITIGRLRRARIASAVVFFAALIVYGLFAIDYAFPGRSAALITFVSGLDVMEVPSRPMLRIFGGYISSLSFSTLTFRLNMCSTVAAALSLGWLYKIIWFFVFEKMREDSSVTQASRISRFAAFSSVLALGLSLPFLYASTRFNSGIFDVALILGCTHLLCVYGRSSNIFWLLLFGVISGVSAAESPLFIVVAPLLIYIAVVTEWKQSWYRISRLSLSFFFSFVSFLLTHWLSARSFLIACGETPVKSSVLSVVVSVLREHIGFMANLLPRLSWFLIIAFGVGFAFITICTTMRSLDNRRSWMLFVVKVALSFLVLVIIFNFSYSAWAIYSARGMIPVVSYLFACSAIGLLAASWRAQALMDDPIIESAEFTPKSTSFNCLRVCGVFIAPALMVLVCVGGILNLRSILKDDGSFMDEAAQQLVKGVGQRKWVVSNGLMDHHILIMADQLKREIILLAPYRVRDRRYCKRLSHLIEREPSFTDKERDWALSLLNYNLHLFVNDFFISRKDISDIAVCMGLPDIWYESKKVPVPEIVFYGGAESISAVDGEVLKKNHDQFLESLVLIKSDAAKFSKLTQSYRDALLHHLAFVSNNLGVSLDEMGMEESAYQVYQDTLVLYPDNISALLNQFEMVSRGVHSEKRDLVEKKVKAKVANMKDRYPLWALNRHFGYIRNYELFVNMGWEWAVSSSPGSVIAGLRRTYKVEQDAQRRDNLMAVMAAVYEMQGDIDQSRSSYEKLVANNPHDLQAISGLVRLSLQSGGIEDARMVLERGQSSGVSSLSLRKDWAALYLMTGDIPKARTILQAMADEDSANTMTVAMLAMVMIEQGDFAGVESKVLPRLSKMAKSRDNYFVNVIQGRLYQRKGKKWYAFARKKFLRAQVIRPDVVALREVIFRLDIAMEDLRAAEVHAIEILRANPSHALANFFMGSVALESGDYGRAEDYLKRSVEGENPTVEALNNYAQLLCRIKRTTKAVKVARRSAKLAPERYEVWSTLAYVLQENDDLDGASKALIKATTINKSDKRLLIIDGLIALKRGDMAAVRRAVDVIDKDKDLQSLPVTSQRDLEILRKVL